MFSSHTFYVTLRNKQDRLFVRRFTGVSGFESRVNVAREQELVSTSVTTWMRHHALMNPSVSRTPRTLRVNIRDAGVSRASRRRAEEL